ncbi:MAG: hypothetical protein KDD89_13455 [Anaerolineales bacterium]|nr:hypothetical protein [Anaerolineales bacterium]
MIGTIPITIHVDEQIAEAYNAADEAQRRKLDALLSLQLSHLITAEQSLEDVMSDLSQKAQARGLTPEILDSLLQDG